MSKKIKLSVNRQESEDQFSKFKLNLKAGDTKNISYQGRDFLIVPVVLLKEAVVNGSLVRLEELIPEAWNGVPVTLNHPVDDQGFYVSANHPDILNKFAVGWIFNCKIEDGKLKGEAWVDVERANKLDEDLVRNLTNDCQMDVSTGYFANHEMREGTYNGDDYFDIASNIMPDHLALLPYCDGACSWADGCGVRSNMKTNIRMNLASRTKEASKDFILKMLDNVKDDLVSTNENGSEIFDEVTKLITNAMDKLKKGDEKVTKKPEVENKQCSCNELSQEDKDSLEFAKNLYKETKKTLVSEIISNNDLYSEPDLESFSIDQLKLIANKSKVQANQEKEDKSEVKEEAKEVKEEAKEAKEESKVDANKEEKQDEKPKADFKGRGLPSKVKANQSEDYKGMENAFDLCGAFKK